MNEHVLELEQRQVDNVYDRAEEKCDELAAPAQGAHAQAAHHVREKREEALAELRELLDQDDQLLVLGRADLREPDDGEQTFYIGRTCLLAEDKSTVLVPWQSPFGKTLYFDRDSGVVDRLLRFQGDSRTIRTIDAESNVDGRLQPDTVDPLLRQLEARVDGTLRNAVATIQADQYGLMEADPDSVMVVQGAPGTGKTIVGLHRISVMVFRSEGEIDESDVLVVGPSRVFLEYVAGLLPSLGQGRVQQVDIGSVGRMADVRVTATDRPARARVKGWP